MSRLNFISDEDLENHVLLTINKYGERLQSFDIKKFNKNIVDPIKMLFDTKIYGYSWKEIVTSEIFRQRDKANNNSIGYFHQKIFKYINNCTVPDKGWDIIFQTDGGIDISKKDQVRTVYVEMKNKHNTMNSSASTKIYQKMQKQILNDDDCACFLVEVIAKKSQNKKWKISLDGTEQQHRRIRRVSIDEFYKIVTGEDDAFYQLCKVLPDVIDTVIKSNYERLTPLDTVISELNELSKQKNQSTLSVIYSLAFETYKGF